VTIGFTFIVRRCWGRGYNAELNGVVHEHVVYRMDAASLGADGQSAHN